MHSIICFGSFLFLLNLPPYWWFIIYSNNINGYKETFPFFAITATVTFISYLICFVLYCYFKYENIKLIKSKNKVGLIWSLLTLFIALLLINIYYYIIATNAGQGSLIVMVAVIPITVLVFVSYLIYHALYFGILEIIRKILSLFKNNDSRDNNEQ